MAEPWFDDYAEGEDEIQIDEYDITASRQYHTWFDWTRNNANTFFAMFGDGFKGHMAKVIDGDENLAKSISDFMEIGRERNRLVHQDYGSFFLEKTAEEIFASYASALLFVEFIPKALRDYSKAILVEPSE